MLAVRSFHLLNNPKALTKLVSELREAIPDLENTPSWRNFEQLPSSRLIVFEQSSPRARSALLPVRRSTLAITTSLAEHQYQ